MSSGVNFTPAKFNVGEGLEKTIVTSTGPYIVTWNFRAVKAGRFTEYKIKRYDEDIVADNFTWGNDRDIVSRCRLEDPFYFVLTDFACILRLSQCQMTCVSKPNRRSWLLRDNHYRRHQWHQGARRQVSEGRRLCSSGAMTDMLEGVACPLGSCSGICMFFSFLCGDLLPIIDLNS